MGEGVSANDGSIIRLGIDIKLELTSKESALWSQGE